jgi:hypothetical protein
LFITVVFYDYFNIEKFINFGPSAGEAICSKKCCSTQWPTTIDIIDDKIKYSDIGTKYSTSNINCNDGITGAGCICLPKAKDGPCARTSWW